MLGVPGGGWKEEATFLTQDSLSLAIFHDQYPAGSTCPAHILQNFLGVSRTQKYQNMRSEDFMGTKGMEKLTVSTRSGKSLITSETVTQW